MSKTTRICLFVAAIAVLTAGVYLGFWHHPRSQVEELAVPPSEIAEETSVTADQELLRPRIPPRKKRIAWEKLELHSNIDVSKWPRIPQNASFVAFSDPFEDWLLHSPIEIYIPQIDQNYRGIVDKITNNGRHSTTIRASPQAGETDLQRLILTYGENQTMAYISTRQGSWELTGDDYLGWIVSTTSLKKGRNYPETDVLNPAYDRYAEAEYVPRKSN